ncbi:hypothetical protein BJ742DRAFT_829728 [Cladochytrium replicatum]|nr:hypothetical protein BJ742DRAFT_829728 [Cladochytrium replicatum]
MGLNQTIDVSFRDIIKPEDFLLQFQDSQPPSIDQVTAVRISNNHLQSLSTLPIVLSKLLPDLTALTWIDVSFNNLTRIDDSLLSLPNLRGIYLHANNLSTLADIPKLVALSHLRTLTLHGNLLLEAAAAKISNGGTYRKFVIAALPQLRHLDFGAITKMDRVVARTLVGEKGLDAGKKGRGRRTDDVVV